MGIGLVHQKSSTQKSNSKRCESEIIGVSEYLPYNLWF